MASLTNTKIKDTYPGLLKTTDNAALGGTYKLITDGLGNSSGVYLGTGGNVGIGQSSPTTYKLDVNGTLQVASGVYAGNYFYHIGDTNTFFGFPGNDTFTVTTNNAERFRVWSNGYVGIGEINPSKPLTIKKDQSETAILVQSSDTGLSGIYLGGITDSIKGGLILDNSDDSIQLRGYDNAERMHIDSSGNIGIGTTNPSVKLSIRNESSSHEIFSITRPASDVPALYLGNQSNNGVIASNFSDLIFGRDFSGTFTENMRITNDGKVGIGYAPESGHGNFNTIITGASTAKFHLGFGTNGDNYYTSGSSGIHVFRSNLIERMRIESDGDVCIGRISAFGGTLLSLERAFGGNTAITINTTTSGTTYVPIKFLHNGTLAGYIATSTTSTSYNTSSDYRLKENVVDMTGALDRIEQLQPKRFNFISDAETTVDGFIAHEVQSVIPEAITGEKDAVDDEGNPQYQGIDQSKIVPLLVGAIKELKAEIETLKSQINS